MTKKQNLLLAAPSHSELYVDNGDGTITDNETGLLWQKATDWTKRNLADTQSYCQNLILAGRDNWVLPANDVLGRIFLDNDSPPSVVGLFECRNDEYWTNDGKVLDFSYTGSSPYYGYASSSETHYARCVIHPDPADIPRWDVNKNHKVDIPDAINALQTAAGFRGN